jgi:HD-GYP domain-containing protein (c-di-GMP phosphodiesterase class II)
MALNTTYSRIEELNIGTIIAEDIFANTKTPIIYKDSKITYEHLHIFEAFNIQNVLIYIEDVLKVTSQDPVTNPINTEFISRATPQTQYNTFESMYLTTVSQFKKEFTNWCAGSKVDVAKVRSIIIPLVDRILMDRTHLYELNSFSNPVDYLYHHCVSIGLVAASIGNKLGFDRGTCIQIGLAGILADSGMAKVPQKILAKKEALTSIEFAEIRKHPIHSYAMVKDSPILKNEMKEAIFKHHERIDGSGYPLGKKIELIRDYSQILALADVYHAMTSERLYRTKQSPFIVIEMIKEAEFGKFDTNVVQALTDLIVQLPIGTKVELSNLERGEVMYINAYQPTRPLIKLQATGELIDLAVNKQYYISRILTQ